MKQVLKNFLSTQQRINVSCNISTKAIISVKYIYEIMRNISLRQIYTHKMQGLYFDSGTLMRYLLTINNCIKIQCLYSYYIYIYIYIYILIVYLSDSVILCENFLKISSLPNRKSQGAEILSKGSPPPPVTCHLSHVICHMSHVLCPVSCVLCHVPLVT